MFQKYYAFYLKCIFLHPSLKIDALASTIKTQKSMAVLAIDELRDNGYVTVEGDLINLTSKGVAYLEKNSLISAADRERIIGFETPAAEKKPPVLRMTMPVVKLKMPAVKLPTIKPEMPGLKIKLPIAGIKKPALAISKNKRLEILAWIIGILCIAAVVGLILAG